MHSQIEVISENGGFRPVGPLPRRFREQQHLTITLEAPPPAADWLADADPTIRLGAVRQALARPPAALAELIHAEREDR